MPLQEVDLDIVSYRITCRWTHLSTTWNTYWVYPIISAERVTMSVTGMQQAVEKKVEKLSFEDYDKKLKDEQAAQQLAVEAYRDLLGDLGCDTANYYLSQGWSGIPTLNVAGLAKHNVEFMFSSHDNTMRLHYDRHHYMIPITDNYGDVVKKIIAILYYVERDEPCDAG